MKYINEKNLYLGKKISKEQWQIVQDATQQYSEEEQLEMTINQANQIYQNNLLSERFDAIDRKYKRKTLFRRLIIAIPFLLLIGVGYYYVNLSKTESVNGKEINETEIESENISVETNPKSTIQKNVEEPKANVEKLDVESTSEETNEPVIEPVDDKKDNIKVFALKRKPIKEGFSFGGSDGEIEFLFHFNKELHLTNFPLISAAFLEGTLENGDYKKAKSLLKKELSEAPNNEELQLFEVVIHLLSKQKIKPNDQLEKLSQLRLEGNNHDLEWCQAYLYYSIRQEDKLMDMHAKLQSTTYKTAVNQLLLDVKD